MFKETNVFEKEMKHQLHLVNQFHNYKPYIQETNVFLYVFLKYMILTHLDTILKSLKSTNYCIEDPQSRKKHYNTIRLHKMDIFKSI